MKLLKLSFKNINSLAGEYEIDFTDEAYRRSGIFAIVGPTGSGKTSILDAICLALYGTTPRLELAPKNTDKEESCTVLTKGSDECYASVTFESDGYVYASRWGRSKGKRSGKLNDATVECWRFSQPGVDDSAELMTDKIKEWKSVIPSITGMTFATFTRSIMLAQGAFSNFLHANKDERADILERITGTDIYTQVSKRVHEEASRARIALEKEEAVLAEIKVLSTQEYQGLFSQKREAEAQQAQWNKRVDQLRQEILWLNAIAQKERDLSLTKAASLRAQTLDEAFEPSRERAKIARRAIQPREALEKRDAAKKALDALDIETREVSAELGLDQTTLSQKEPELQSSVLALSKASEAQQLFEPLAREIIKADAHIKNLEERRLRAGEALEKNLEAHRRAQKEYRERYDELRQLEAQLLANVQALDETRIDEALRTELSAFEPMVRAYDDSQARVERLAQDVAAHRAELDRFSLVLSQVTMLRDEAQKKYEIAQGAFNIAKDKATIAMEGTDIEQQIQLVCQASDRIAQGQALLLALNEVKRYTEKMDELTNCPPVLSEDAREWRATFLTSLQEDLYRWNARLVSLSREDEIFASDIQGRGIAALDEWQSVRDKAYQWSVEAGKAQLSLKHAQEEYLEADKALRALSDEVEKQGFAIKAEKGALAKEEILLTEAYRSRDVAQTRYREKASLFLPQDVLDNTSCEEVLALLKARRETRETLNARHLKLEPLVIEKRAQVRALESVVNERGVAARTQREALDEIDAVLARATKERVDCWGTLCVEQRQGELRAQVEAAQARTASLRADIAKLKEAVSAKSQKYLMLREQKDRAQEALQHSTQALKRALRTAGFESESSLQNITLRTEEIGRIEEEGQRLKEERAAKNALFFEAIQALENEKAKALSSQNILQAQETLAKAIEQQELSLMEISRIQTLLEQDDKQQKALQRRKNTLLSLTQTASRWHSLNALIGSHDGKVFRLFAQKITFRMLLKLANEALSQMTKRYLLDVSGSDGLSLCVLDMEMGGVVRTAQNLSGGESFIVSLALALGLSKMGGRHLSVDTLFLDEGFGTLDEVALDKALYALENLQSQTGKLIGVISHVKAVRERIGAHIAVRSVPALRTSMLKGPGVTKRE